MLVLHWNGRGLTIGSSHAWLANCGLPMLGSPEGVVELEAMFQMPRLRNPPMLVPAACICRKVVMVTIGTVRRIKKDQTSLYGRCRVLKIRREKGTRAGRKGDKDGVSFVAQSERMCCTVKVKRSKEGRLRSRLEMKRCKVGYLESAKV